METSFLSSEGSIKRAAFAVRILAITLFAAVLSFTACYYFAHYFHHGEFFTLGIFCSIVIAIIAKLVGFMQVLKRLRDMGKEAYLSLALLIPGANVLFLIYVCLAPSKK